MQTSCNVVEVQKDTAMEANTSGGIELALHVAS
jgi:hypothetical protein